jgi:hypothetical protein
MSVRQVRVYGRTAWQARVALRGLGSSRIWESKAAARAAEAEPLQELTRATTVPRCLSTPASTRRS